MKSINYVRFAVRHAISKFAKKLDKISKSKVNANHITLISLLGHFLVFYLIVTQNFPLAAVALLIFGLFDTLDGELARIQNKASAYGMIFDATSDRVKEGIVFAALTYYYASNDNALLATSSALAILISNLISYIKAKGEAVISDAVGPDKAKLNKVFAVGLMGYEVRTFLIILGLFINRVEVALSLIIMLGAITAWLRYLTVIKTIRLTDD